VESGVKVSASRTIQIVPKAHNNSKLHTIDGGSKRKWNELK